MARGRIPGERAATCRAVLASPVATCDGSLSLEYKIADFFSQLCRYTALPRSSHAAKELCLLVLKLLTGDHSIGLELLEDYQLG